MTGLVKRVLRIASVAALGLYLVSIAWLGRLEKGGPAHADVQLEGGIPATLYLPEEGTERTAFLDTPPLGERPAAIVLMHGFASERNQMSTLARGLAGSGYAVLAIDVRGHGQNRTPFARSWARGDAFFPELAAAVDFLRASPHVDGSRLVVMGHSMGAGASLDYATRDSGIDGVVLISGGWTLHGPYRPPNALFIYASGDPERIRSRSNELAARIAGVPRLELSQTYGELANGTAVRVVELPGLDHATIAWSDATVREIVAWLDAIFGVERAGGEPPSDPRWRPLLLAGIALPFLLLGLGQLVGRIAPARDERPAAGAATGLHGLVVALVLTTPLLATGTPGPILSVEVRDVVVTHFALCGVALLVVLARKRRAELLSLFRDPVPTLLGASLGVIAIYLLMHPVGSVLHRITLTPERTLVFALAALGILPFSAAFQLLLRRGRPRVATLYCVAGRVAVLGTLLLAVKVGLLGGVVLLMLPAFALIFVLLEVVAASIYAQSRNLAAISLIDAGWVALIVAAIMPIRI